MKTIIATVLIICIVAAVIFILPLLIMFCSYVFGIEMDEYGNLRECIGCPEYDKRGCGECKINKKAERIRAKQEKKHRRKEKLH